MYHADTMTEKDKEDVKNEAKILATLNHPNIVQYQETYTVSTCYTAQTALLSSHTLSVIGTPVPLEGMWHSR